MTRGRYPSLSEHDAEEIAADAITALFEATRAQRQIAEPFAWLIATARNAAYDRWKAEQRTTPAEDPAESIELTPEGEDALQSLIDALADRQLVKLAIRAALAADDRTVVRVVVAWLDLYETTGAVPPVRRVGTRADVPASTVAKALSRFARYLRTTPDS